MWAVAGQTSLSLEETWVRCVAQVRSGPGLAGPITADSRQIGHCRAVSRHLGLLPAKQAPQPCAKGSNRVCTLPTPAQQLLGVRGGLAVGATSHPAQDRAPQALLGGGRTATLKCPCCDLEAKQSLQEDRLQNGVPTEHLFIASLPQRFLF